MGVFEFIIALVLISTAGKVLTARSAAPPKEKLKPREEGDLAYMREALHELSGRVERLEEERDFYRNLLESPNRPKVLPTPEDKPDATDELSD